jgi:hypothetical protein
VIGFAISRADFRVLLPWSSFGEVCFNVHHVMARPRVADRGGGLQVRRITANTLNKQLRTADKGWSSSFGVGWRADNFSPQENQYITTYYTGTRRYYYGGQIKEVPVW